MKNTTPAVLVYYEDLLSGTDYMNDAEFGQYVRLLMRQNVVGHMSKDYLSRIHIKKVFDCVLDKFSTDSEGKIFNKRMEEEIQRRVDYQESRKRNRRSKTTKEDEHISKHMSEHISPHMREHMETETETETEIYKKQKGKQKTKTETLEKAEQIIDHLNDRLGTRYRSTNKNTLSLIKGRLADGYDVTDFFTVIDKKATEWQGTEWAKFLRPDTLFRPSKFESYLNQSGGPVSNIEIARAMDEAERRQHEQGTSGESIRCSDGYLPADISEHDKRATR